VERLWPRGIRKESLHFSDWLRDVAPSDALRRWFQHAAAKWTEFQRRYQAELDHRPDAWKPILDAARAGVFCHCARKSRHAMDSAIRRRRAGIKNIGHHVSRLPI
jgi:uncharacterized protein YeaO (DUF488 family)